MGGGSSFDEQAVNALIMALATDSRPERAAFIREALRLHELATAHAEAAVCAEPADETDLPLLRASVA